MTKRIWIIVWWWDCPWLNTVVASIVKALPDYEIYGFIKSWDGLLDKQYKILDRSNTSHMRRVGGTILKTVNKWRFGFKVWAWGVAILDPELVKETKQSYDELWLDCVCVLGGDGTLGSCIQLQEAWINCIGIPKSIDNDLMATDYQFGFMTSVEIVTEAMQRLHTTASSHDRVMVLEVMGRHTGWIALYGGIAGWASMILLPEMPFSYEAVIKHLEARRARGRTSHVIVVSEWAYPTDGEKVVKNDGWTANEILLWWIGEALTRYLNTNTDFETRNNQLAHIQRGGSPYAFDLMLSSMYGAYAAQMVRNQEFGSMVTYHGTQLGSAKIADAVSWLKSVDPAGQMVKLAQSMGISFGQ